MSELKQNIEKIKKDFEKEKNFILELEKISGKIQLVRSIEEKNLVMSKIDELKKEIKKQNLTNKTLLENIHKRDIFSDTKIDSGKFFGTKGGKIFDKKDLAFDELEKETLKRIHKKEKEEKSNQDKKTQEKSEYAKIAYKTFSKISRELIGKNSFQTLEKQLIKANLNFTPLGYISTILFTTLLSAIVGGFLFLFFLFFDLSSTLPLVMRAGESINVRFLKVFWLLFAVPIGTFFIMYVYPSLERKALEQMINLELPFATIHMAAISGSLISPIKIFEIIISTGDYPALQKEFTKMINEINVYGYDLVSALKDTAKNSPSKNLTELLNGIATTINSGGDLTDFFDKRSQTLLFDYKIERDKSNKSAESFMDIYISLGIASPMILMLLLMIMKMSGLGMSASVGTITLIILLVVTVMNIVFLTFLNLKRKTE